MDPLSDIIALLRPHTALAKPITGRGDWGVRYAAYDLPGFAIVLAGQCWLAIDGADPVQLQRGDFVLLPSTPAFALFSRPGVTCVSGVPADRPVRHGAPDGEPDFQMLGGSFRIEPVNAPLLIELLPRLIHSRAADTGRLTRIIDLIGEEGAAEWPGRDMILERLLEVMLVEALRWQSSSGEALSTSLLAGMREPALAKALGAMHSDIKAGWTVVELARRVGMSRSAFAARFADCLGCGPIEYLARWRMALAKDALSRGKTALEPLAEAIGYESASAFSTAFRRRIGCSPGAFSRACRGEDGAAATQQSAAR
jgi:AraC-like DNA-binding protein